MQGRKGGLLELCNFVILLNNIYMYILVLYTWMDDKIEISNWLLKIVGVGLTYSVEYIGPDQKTVGMFADQTI